MELKEQRQEVEPPRLKGKTRGVDMLRSMEQSQETERPRLKRTERSVNERSRSRSGSRYRPREGEAGREMPAVARPKLIKVVQEVNLATEHANDIHDSRIITVAEGRVRSEYTASAEVETDSEYRLAWIFIEGWRARLRKSGDVVEKARWEWRVGDLMDKAHGRQVSSGNTARRRGGGPDVIALVPSCLRKSGNGNENMRVDEAKRRKKSVHWLDDVDVDVHDL